MTYQQACERAQKAIHQIRSMGTWDSIYVDLLDGKPVIYAVVRRNPVRKFLLDLGVFKKPELPETVDGIKCEVRIHYPLKAEKQKNSPKGTT